MPSSGELLTCFFWMPNRTRSSHHIKDRNEVPLKETMKCALLDSPSQISKLGSNDARQDFKSLWRKTLEEFHFLSAQEQSSSFAVIILGVVVEEEVTCSGNIGPSSAGSGVCVCGGRAGVEI